MKAQYLLLFATTLLALFASGQGQLTIDTNGFVGCYSRDWTNYEFSVHVSYLSTGILTPTTCIKACASMSYKQSAIVDGTMCFCKATTGVISTPVSSSYCESVACSGDSTLACGAPNTLMVYDSQGIVMVNISPSFHQVFVTHALPVTISRALIFSSESSFRHLTSTHRCSSLRYLISETTTPLPAKFVSIWPKVGSTPGKMDALVHSSP